eukprot:683963-Amphidinium_carterae.2
MPFSSIQVTCSQATEGLPAHQDAGNFGLSDIIGLGAYEGGQLWVSSSSGHERLPEKLQPIHERISPSNLRGAWHDIKRKWLVFDGKAWHCSRPYTGQRISVIFFNPSGIHTLPPAAHQRLQQLGFLVPQRPHEEQSWLTTVDAEPVDLQYATNPAGKQEKTVIVVAEKLRQLANALHQDGFHILRTSHAHIKARRTLPQDLAMIKQDLAEFKPQLLWLQWQGMQTPGRRAQTKLLCGFLQECIATAWRPLRPRDQIIRYPHS